MCVFERAIFLVTLPDFAHQVFSVVNRNICNGQIADELFEAEYRSDYEADESSRDGSRFVGWHFVVVRISFLAQVPIVFEDSGICGGGDFELRILTLATLDAEFGSGDGMLSILFFRAPFIAVVRIPTECEFYGHPGSSLKGIRAKGRSSGFEIYRRTFSSSRISSLVDPPFLWFVKFEFETGFDLVV